MEKLQAMKKYDRLVVLTNEDKANWKGYNNIEENQINELGLNRCVFLDGFKSNMKEEYLDASLFVLSSRYEGFGMVLLEAMSCGVPAVSFDCPCGPKDLITDGENGYLVEDDDIEKLADRIVYLIRHPEKRKEMGTMAYKRSADYSEDKIMKQWMELFSEVLADSKKNS